jgi:hypothetical protein
MSDDCVVCGKWPDRDRWALRAMTDSLPLQEIEMICDEWLDNFWRRLPHVSLPPNPTSQKDAPSTDAIVDSLTIRELF